MILNLYDENIIEKINSFLQTNFTKLPNENTREEIKFETKEYWYKMINKVLIDLEIESDLC